MEPLHESIHELGNDSLIHVLESNTLGHLGCTDGNEVYVVPISYVYSDGDIYAHSLPGKKIDLMRTSSSVCLQVENVKDFFHWKSVIVQGVFEELRGTEAESAMRLLIKKLIELDDESGTSHSDLELDFAALLQRSIIYRIKVISLSGRYENVGQ